MFGKQRLWLPLWQTLADFYHPQRAEFTEKRGDKSEYAQNIFESTPILHRRDFSLAMGAILRPPGKDWFSIRAQSDELNSEFAVHWFNKTRERIRAYLYSGTSGFARALRESDDDFATFGNSVIGITENLRRNGLRFVCYHLRDCAWAENSDGQVYRLDRKETFTLRQKVDLFGLEALRADERELLKTDPEKECSILVCCMPLKDYDPEREALIRAMARGVDPDMQPIYCVVYIDEQEKKELKVDWYPYFPYWVRRWEMTRGEVYAYSPPAMIGLPDARMAQTLAQITIEAAEKQLDPPLIATRDALWEGPNVFAGGITWVDKEYDERLGEAIRPLDLGKNAGVGLDLRNDIRQLHAGTFYITKLSLPLEGDMTAYEVGQRIDEYIRTIGPVLEPFEADNARLLDLIFTILFLAGGLGPMEAVPPELQGADVTFKFETPVQAAYERRKMLAAKELLEFTNQVAGTTQDPTVIDNLNGDAMVREAAMIVGTELGWLVHPDDVVAKRVERAQEAEAQRQKQEQMEQLQLLTQGAQLAPLLANADQTLQQIMGPDWLQTLTGAQQAEANRLLPRPDEMEQEDNQAEDQAEMMPPMPMSPEEQMPRNGFVGRMPQGQQRAMPQAQPQGGGMDQFAGVMQQLAVAIDRLASASMAETETYRTPEGNMRARKVMTEGAV